MITQQIYDNILLKTLTIWYRYLSSYVPYQLHTVLRYKNPCKPVLIQSVRANTWTNTVHKEVRYPNFPSPMMKFLDISLTKDSSFNIPSTEMEFLDISLTKDSSMLITVPPTGGF